MADCASTKFFKYTINLIVEGKLLICHMAAIHDQVPETWVKFRPQGPHSELFLEQRVSCRIFSQNFTFLVRFTIEMLIILTLVQLRLCLALHDSLEVPLLVELKLCAKSTLSIEFLLVGANKRETIYERLLICIYRFNRAHVALFSIWIEQLSTLTRIHLSEIIQKILLNIN